MNMNFVQGTMKGLLSANTMLSASKMQSKAISQTEGRIRVLKSEIKLGTGATEAKKEELSLMEEKLKNTQKLHLNTMEEANNRLTAVTEKTDDSNENAVKYKNVEDNDENKTVQEIYLEIVEGKKSETYELNGKIKKDDETGTSIDYML